MSELDAVMSTCLQPPATAASHLFGLHTSALCEHRLSVATCEQAWLVHVSTVQLTLSVEQSLAVLHSWQVGVPLGSHTGLAELQPASNAPPALVSTQATHFSAEAVPLHTPVAQAVPAVTAANTHLPAVQVSVVHSLPSVQSLAEEQPVHAASSPTPRQIGAVAEQPASCPVPGAESRQRTQSA